MPTETYGWTAAEDHGLAIAPLLIRTTSQNTTILRGGDNTLFSIPTGRWVKDGSNWNTAEPNGFPVKEVKV